MAAYQYCLWCTLSLIRGLATSRSRAVVRKVWIFRPLRRQMCVLKGETFLVHVGSLTCFSRPAKAVAQGMALPYTSRHEEPYPYTATQNLKPYKTVKVFQDETSTPRTSSDPETAVTCPAQSARELQRAERFELRPYSN
ncbi:hypothetical protein ElyMa_003880600 [Elysia marginata]|uniref:Uncharacterized protein n=1 Tax=Elysia marginata TaxID=1093978 RepID=A0AAV4FLY8_9GAST|nr:hypothetical protein ElyMa_003880600 [Elysia marginata]